MKKTTVNERGPYINLAVGFDTCPTIETSSKRKHAHVERVFYIKSLITGGKSTATAL